MYTPAAFSVTDPGKLAAFIQRHSFATLVTHDGTAPFASHLPMLFRPDAGPNGTLVSHMARANPQWRHFAAGGEALVIFHGPHSYISPSWYQSAPAVPTWNYAVVHACGVPSIFDEHERVVSLLRETVAAYEQSFEQPWSGELPDEFRDRLIAGIVAFDIPIARLEGKFKLGQNRSAEDLRGVFDALSNSGDGDSRALARMMQSECNIAPARELRVGVEDPTGDAAQRLVAELRTELSARYGTPPSAFSPADVQAPRTAFVVARLGTEAVGCGAIRRLDDETAELKRMYVTPEGRRKGIARRILDELERRAAAFGYRTIRLETGKRQPEAIGLYTSAGYQQIDSFGTHVGNSASVCFEKHLGFPATENERNA